MIFSTSWNCGFQPSSARTFSEPAMNHSCLARCGVSASFSAMSITAIVENDTIKLPTHVPDGTRVEIVLPGESAAGGKSFYDAAYEFIGMFEGPRDLSTKPDPFDAMIGSFHGKAEATGRHAEEILYGRDRPV